ncbi:MAG: hydrogenase formation protein HypD [Phycisphaerales bacterium]|nr:hydrogenase formation protein HypD [Phycisphaerales bacterium]
MKYLDEFRDGRLAQGLAARIRREVEPERRYALMEFCGGHTHAICRYGIEDLLPAQIRLIHGPGCPVCVLPSGRLQAAIHLLENEDVILCSFGDLLRVPGLRGDTLFKAKARGADVRMVYSISDALNLARTQSERHVLFFAIGFETTAPSTAVAIAQAQREGLNNFSVYCNHLLTPPALRALLEMDHAPILHDGTAQGSGKIDGFIGPAHVSTIIGTRAYEFVAATYRRPLVIAGFEPLDVLQSILMLVRQINASAARVENEYTRAVSADGNRKAQKWMEEIFMLRPHFEWRGLGELPDSALAIQPEFADWDAERRFTIPSISASDHKACACAEVLRGVIRPQACPVFATVCTPDHPLGACMVSPEGACAAHYHYGRFRQAVAS